MNNQTLLLSIVILFSLVLVYFFIKILIVMIRSYGFLLTGFIWFFSIVVVILMLSHFINPSVLFDMVLSLFSGIVGVILLILFLVGYGLKGYPGYPGRLPTFLLPNKTRLSDRIVLLVSSIMFILSGIIFLLQITRL